MYNLGTLIALAERQDRMAGRSSRRQHFLTTSDRLWSYGKNLLPQSARVGQEVKNFWGSYLKRQYRTGNAELEICYSWSKKDIRYLQEKLNSTPPSLFPSSARVMIDSAQSSELATSLICQHIRNGSFQSLEIKVLSPSFIVAAMDFVRAAKGRETLVSFSLDLDMNNDSGVSEVDNLFADLKRVLCHGNCCIKQFSFNCNKPLSEALLTSLWTGLAKNKIESLELGLNQRDNDSLTSLEEIMSSFSFSGSLRQLTLKGNNYLSIQNAGDRLGAMLERHSGLEKLMIKDRQDLVSNQHLGETSSKVDVQPFADAIEAHKSLRELTLELHSTPKLDPESLVVILSACARQQHSLQSCLVPHVARLQKTSSDCSIESNPRVTLTMSRCLDSGFVYKLSNLLPGICQFISHLRLFLDESRLSSRQQEQSLGFLTRIFEHAHCRVTDLSLSRSSENGIQYLINGLKQYPRLKALSLDQCALTDEQLQDLSASLTTSAKCFERLTLHDAGLDASLIPVFVDLLKSFPNLQVLNLANNDLLSQSSTGATPETAANEGKLLEALQNHCRLQRFHVKASFSFHLCAQQVLQRNQFLHHLLQDPTQACNIPSSLRARVIQRLGQLSGHNALFLFATEIPGFWS